MIARVLLFMMACTLSAASASLRAIPSTSSVLGALRIAFGVSAVASFKQVQLMTKMSTYYKAGYLYAPEDSLTLEHSWQQGVGNRRDVYCVPLNAPLVDAAQRLLPQAFAERFMFAGVVPENVLRGSDNGNENWARVNRVPCSPTLLAHALFARGAAHDNAPNLPDNKALILPQNYQASGEQKTPFSYTDMGVRLELMLAGQLYKSFALGCLMSYFMNLKDKDEAHKSGLRVVTEGEGHTFKSISGNEDIAANVVKASFAYAQGNLAQDLSWKVHVSESLGFMGFVAWSPVERCDLMLHCGAKCYTVQANLHGGALSYPGTVSMYTNDFTYRNDVYKLLLYDSDRVRRFSAKVWPVTWALGLRFRIFGLSCIALKVEYAAFEEELYVANYSSKVDRVKMEQPYEALPTRDQMANGRGIHQMLATDVHNDMRVTVSVQDVTVSLGYVLAF